MALTSYRVSNTEGEESKLTEFILPEAVEKCGFSMRRSVLFGSIVNNMDFDAEAMAFKAKKQDALSSAAGLGGYAEPVASQPRSLSLAGPSASASAAITITTGSSTQNGEYITYRIDDTKDRAIDAEKTGVDDTNLCWAATASNMLYWSGWSSNLSMNFKVEDDLLSYFASNFTDQGGYSDYGLSWFFNGQYKAGKDDSQLKTTTGGGFCQDYNFSKYIFCYENAKTALSSLVTNLDKGYVCGLGIYWLNGGGHAVTCWGYTYNTSVPKNSRNYITGLWISDSDNNYGEGRSAPDEVNYCTLKWNNAKQYYEVSVNYLTGTSVAYLGSVTAIATYSVDFTSSVTISNVNSEIVRAGTQTISSNGTATNNTVSVDGLQNISSGGLATKSVVTSGGIQGVYLGGSAHFTEVRSGGNQNIYEGGVASRTTVSSGGTQTIVSGGRAEITDLHGVQAIYGGSAYDAKIYGTAKQSVEGVVSGGSTYLGYSYRATISAGGTQTVLANGIAVSTIAMGISNGSAGIQIISNGGLAQNALLGTNGVQQVCSGGSAAGTVVGNNASQMVSSGATSTDTTVSSGGSSIICSGAILTGQLYLSGQAIIANAASLNTLSKFSLAVANSNYFMVVQKGVFSSSANWSINLDNAKLGIYTLAYGKADLSSMVGKSVSVTLGSETISVVVGNTATSSANVTVSYTSADGGNNFLKMEYANKALVGVTETTGSATEGSNAIVYHFTRTGSTSKALTVNFSVGGTATYGTDYTLSSGAKSVVFAAGSSDAYVTLSTVADTEYEGDESVSLKISSNGNYQVGSNRGALSDVISDSQKDTVGNTVATATKLTLATQVSGGVAASAGEQVSAADKKDFYEFTTTATGSFIVALAGSTAKTAGKATLYKLVNGAAKALGAATLANGTLSISKVLEAGDYYVAVESVKSKICDYTLSVAGNYFPAASDDNTKAKAQTLSGSASGWVGYGDAIDFFKTSAASASKVSFTAEDANAKLLIFSSKDNGTTLKQVASYTAQKGVALERNLAALSGGDYYFEVVSLDGKATSAKYNTYYTISSLTA